MLFHHKCDGDFAHRNGAGDGGEKEQQEKHDRPQISTWQLLEDVGQNFKHQLRSGFGLHAKGEYHREYHYAGKNGYKGV